MIDVLARDLDKSFGNKSSLELANDIVLVSLDVLDPFGLYCTASIGKFLYRFIDVFNFQLKEASSSCMADTHSFQYLEFHAWLTFAGFVASLLLTLHTNSYHF